MKTRDRTSVVNGLQHQLLPRSRQIPACEFQNYQMRQMANQVLFRSEYPAL